MKELKKYFKWILLLVIFIVLSELLITAALNCDYVPMKRLDNIPEVEISEAVSTIVNGKMTGKIKASENNYLTNKYVLVELFSKRNIMVGKKYIPITTTQANLTQDFSFLFELKDVESYKVSIVDEKTETKIEIKPIETELSRSEIFFFSFLSFVLFWT